ncbi:FecR domain-containing protein [Stenotrophomonas sp. SY1]|uniref:FecR family protein n=1 Tax=Stenotrophomonas sp. SY1 TaxID=477235 RepID=UPI001E50131B|nr:FecR domain-containing protein [Stenotrophomonas sp. SY1]MCD9088676.1 FecR domain-containing protein [Stenotrophomonas sp. SY1]
MNRHTDGIAGETLAQQALDWFLLHREGSLNALQRAAFLQWLQRSPEHVRAYLHALDLHRQVGGAMAAVQLDAQVADVAAISTRDAASKVVPLFATSTPRSVNRRTRRTWKVLAAAAAAGMALLLGALVPQLWPEEQVLTAGHGQLRELVLADRTQVRLNADSAIRVRMGWLSRRVELLHGEATFDVAPDRRAFEVRVEQLQIRDIGTVFDVSRRLQSTRIGVVSGQVEVWSRAAEPQRLAQLDAGRVVLVDNHSHAVQALDMPASMLLDWQQRKVSFLDERLDEVASAFNRHNQVQVVVEDEAAAAMRLSGSLDAHRIAALQVFLSRDPRFVVRRDGDTVHVSSR